MPTLNKINAVPGAIMGSRDHFRGELPGFNISILARRSLQAISNPPSLLVA